MANERKKPAKKNTHSRSTSRRTSTRKKSTRKKPAGTARRKGRRKTNGQSLFANRWVQAALALPENRPALDVNAACSGFLYALDLAQATEFVEKLPGGIEAPIAEGGTNVSGGQKQRISIARALARKPEILVFDDSFSALDYRTDAKLRAGLEERLKHTTRLIVAQRIGTIRNADKIIVLDEGRAVGVGTHEELMQSCPVYQEIARSQLSKEELEA